jgi:dihydropteroate synthase
MRFCFRDRFLDFDGDTLIVGILNVTPDSFSDGGDCSCVDEAVSKAGRMMEEGASIVDVGGESTRPGFTPVGVEEELARVVPVVQGIRGKYGEQPIISVDTSKAPVAAAALEAGADIINDVSALEIGGMEMCDAIGKHRAGCILMHPGAVQDGADPMEAIASYLADRLDYAIKGTCLDRSHFAVDPGIGFGKDLAQNLRCCVDYSFLRRLERPIFIGVSRKSCLGLVTGRTVDSREYATAASSAIAAYLGADMLRVHNVSANKDAVSVAKALRNAAMK